jgi:hypothetical protein
MCWPRRLVALAVAAAIGCGGGGEGSDSPETPSAPTPPPAPAAPAAPAAPTAPPQGNGRSILQLELERRGTRPDVSAADLEILAVGLFFESVPAAPAHGSACDLSAAERFDTAFQLQVPLAVPGTSPFARLESARSGRIAELRIFLRGELVRKGKRHNLDGAETCVWGDGFDVAVFRVRPMAPLVAVDGKDFRVLIPFDARELVREERVACVAGASLAAASSSFHDRDGPDECRAPDDPDDDQDPATRLRYVLVGQTVCTAHEAG